MCLPRPAPLFKEKSNSKEEKRTIGTLSVFEKKKQKINSNVEMMSKPFRIAKLISEKLSQIHSLLRKTLVCLMFNVKINYLKHKKNTTVENPILEGVYNRVHRS